MIICCMSNEHKYNMIIILRKLYSMINESNICHLISGQHRQHITNYYGSWLHLISCLKQDSLFKNFTLIQCSSVYRDAAQTKNGKMGMENVNWDISYLSCNFKMKAFCNITSHPLRRELYNSNVTIWVTLLI